MLLRVVHRKDLSFGAPRAWHDKGPAQNHASAPPNLAPIWSTNGVKGKGGLRLTYGFAYGTTQSGTGLVLKNPYPLSGCTAFTVVQVMHRPSFLSLLRCSAV